MATILLITLTGVLMISTAVAPQAYAAGGLMQLVGYFAQDNPLGAIVPGLCGH
jgi:hypothetical protein